MRAEGRGGGLVAGLALLALANVGVSSVQAQAVDPSIRERLFVVRAERAGVPLRVTSLVAGDAFEGTTSEAGMLVFELHVARDDEIRFTADSGGWKLDWVTKVRNTHLAPDIPLELDVGAFLQRASPSVPVEGPTAAGDKTPGDSLACRVGDIQCLLALQRRLAAAHGQGDCRTALELALRLTSEAPDFAASDPGAVELATLHFECALLEAAEGDRNAREELLLRRALAIAGGEYGTGWCHPQRSRILAATYGELRETAAAAASARRARLLCPDQSAPLEWEFYFRLGLGQVGLAAQVADDLALQPRFVALGGFLRAWARFAGGTCPEVAEQLGATPCTVLPAGACERARTSWTLRCSDDGQLATFAEQLRVQLAAAPEAGREQILEDLAEVESARGEPASAAELLGRLLETDASPARRGSWACRQGDALLRAGRPGEALQAFELASSAWDAQQLSVSRLDRLVVDNNVLVLRSGLRGTLEAERLVALAAQIEALGDEAPMEPWRLAVENNLLELRTRSEAQQAGSGPAAAREALDRLRAIEAEYRRHVQSVAEIGGSGERPLACSILAFAGDFADKLEDGASGEPE